MVSQPFDIHNVYLLLLLFLPPNAKAENFALGGVLS